MAAIDLTDQRPPASAGPAPTLTVKPHHALIMIPALFVVLGAFVGLSLALGSAELFVGFSFLFYWAGVQQADMKALPAAAVGAFVGLSLALAMHLLTGRFGATTGILMFIGLLLPVIFCQLVGLLTLAVNNATNMLLLSGTITYVQAHANFKAMFINLAVAIVYFGVLLWGVSKLRERAEAKAAAGG